MQTSLPGIQRFLTRTPLVLRAQLDGHDEQVAHQSYGPSTWSPHDILAHLIFGERTDWLPRLRIILQHADTRPFDPFDRQGHADLARAHSTSQLLDLFQHERENSLRALSALNLSPADFDRPGRHPALGSVTLSNLLATWVVHDLNHIAQIAKALAFQYRAAVGPWEQYLSILAPPNPR